MSVQVILVALIFAGIGIYALAAPQRVFAMFGVPVETAEGRNEIRAVYGGMCLAVAVILFELPWLGSAANGILLTVMTLLAGMAFGRLVSLLFERPGMLPYAFLALELVGAGLLYSVIDMTALSGA